MHMYFFELRTIDDDDGRGRMMLSLVNYCNLYSSVIEEGPAAGGGSMERLTE